MAPRLFHPTKGDLVSLEADKKAIDEMSREAMCELHRFAPVGHPYFVRGTPLSDHWKKVFKAKGGFSPAISKRIGW